MATEVLDRGRIRGDNRGCESTQSIVRRKREFEMPRITVMVLVGLLLGSCSTHGSELESTDTRCSDPRPEMCTREYVPVCGNREDGSTKTYGNGCTACSDPSVVSFSSGACS